MSFPAEVTAAIQQLSANQTAMMQQFTAFTVINHSPPTRRNVQVPPVTNINIPQQQYGGFPQPTGGFQQGRGGRQGGGRSHGGGHGGRRGGRVQNAYAQAPGGKPQYLPQMGGPQKNHMPGFNNGGIVPAVAGRQATSRGGHQNSAYSNQYKIFSNWNVCYSHGFDVKDGHNSATCGIRKMDHQEGFTRENAQAYIDAGYAPITWRMHRNILPTNFLQCGAKIDNANKCNHLVSTNVLSFDPNLNVVANVTVVQDDDDATVITSNHSHRQRINKTAVQEQPLTAATARATFGNPMPQYLNMLTIAANKAIADTGATTIFIMDNTEVDNKGIATKLLKINLPDGTTIWSTHVCNIKIPGLPKILTGHIVPSLKNSLSYWDSTFMQGRMQSRV